MIDPAKLREQRASVRRPTKPKGLGCFKCGTGVGAGNWYGLCLRCVSRTPMDRRGEFREMHLKRTGRAA